MLQIAQKGLLVLQIMHFLFSMPVVYRPHPLYWHVLMWLCMLMLSVGKGRQVIQQLCVPCHEQSEVWKLYCAVDFISYEWSIETCHCRGQESVSDSILAIEALTSMCLVDCACTILLMTLFHMYTIKTMQLLGMWSSFSFCIIVCERDFTMDAYWRMVLVALP